MLATNLADVTADRLAEVCTRAWGESSTLDFKRDLPGNSDKDRHELLKDVTALANADGGDLVFGLDEVAGTASALAPVVSEPADAAVRRLAQMIEAGVEPRVQGLEFVPVSVPGGYVLVVRVPSSYHGPHSVRVNTARRFVVRNGTSTSDMTFDQLRQAFDRTATLSERAQQFIAERTRVMMERTTPKQLIPGPIRAIHLVPLSGLSGRQGPDLQASYANFVQLLEPEWGGGSRVFNLDGLLVHPAGSEEGHYGYAQVFRNGAFEGAALAGGPHQADPSEPEELFVWALDMTQFFRERTKTFLVALRQQGFSGPAVLSISVLHVQNHLLGVQSFFGRRRRPEPDRPHLVAPPAWIPDVSTVQLDEVVRPLLDTLWQGFGVERCLDYDAKSGEFRPHSR